MANTALLQAVAQMLMQGRNPSPLVPVPIAPAQDFGPLSMETASALRALQPEPVPPAPPPPVDMDAIRARFASLAGPEPVAPVARPDPLILKIALALQGFGAGTQGRGPEFLAGLEEQRARPRREFEAKKERFESRKAELGLLAEQEISGAERRRETRVQELLDNQFEREFKEGARRLNLRDQKELDLFRDTLLAKRQREDDERQAERLQKQQEQQTKIKLADLSSKYRALGAKDAIATELAQKDLDPAVKLSPAAAKWYSARAALDEARANRAARGGGTGTGGVDKQTTRLVEEFNQARENLITAYANGQARAQQQIRMRLDQLVRQLAGKPGIEVGYGEGQWPYLKVNGVLQGAQGAAPAQQQTATQAPAQQQTATQAPGAPQTATQAQLQQYATENGISIEEAREDFRKAGIQIVG